MLFKKKKILCLPPKTSTILSIQSLPLSTQSSRAALLQQMVPGIISIYFIMGGKGHKACQTALTEGLAGTREKAEDPGDTGNQSSKAGTPESHFLAAEYVFSWTEKDEASSVYLLCLHSQNYLIFIVTRVSFNSLQSRLANFTKLWIICRRSSWDRAQWMEPTDSEARLAEKSPEHTSTQEPDDKFPVPWPEHFTRGRGSRWLLFIVGRVLIF